MFEALELNLLLLKIIDLKQKGANLNNIKIKLVLPDLKQAITAKKMKNESKIGYK